ncbi:MAG: ECF-type sigma factor [Planctomycetota bacterium]|jgi:RNA polymerase sigma factor (TIGR02999 family)
MPVSNDITRLLHEVDDGRRGAMDELMEAVYADLQRVAQRHMAERFGPGLAGVTLEPAALVNESFMKLIKQRKRYDNRAHFFAIATKVMLRVLLDYERRRGTAKRGGGRKRITLDLNGSAGSGRGPGLHTRIAVESLVESLERLEGLDPRKADVVKLRVVWGLEMAEIAESLGVSLATVERDWSFAKAWLAREANAARDEGATGGDEPAPR